MAFFVLEKDSINVELKKSEIEAIRILMTKFEQLQKENEKLKEIDLTTVHIKGVCDEKERWRNKIKEKIEELKPKLEETVTRREAAGTQEERGILWSVETRLDERIKALNDLLKGE